MNPKCIRKDVKYMDSCNRKKLHSAIDYKTPNEVYYDYISNLDFRGGKLSQSASWEDVICKVVLLVLKKGAL